MVGGGGSFVVGALVIVLKVFDEMPLTKASSRNLITFV